MKKLAKLTTLIASLALIGIITYLILNIKTPKYIDVTERIVDKRTYLRYIGTGEEGIFVRHFVFDMESGYTTAVTADEYYEYNIGDYYTYERVKG